MAKKVNQQMVAVTQEVEGFERPAVLITLFSPNGVGRYLVYSYMSDGKSLWFDTTEDYRVIVQDVPYTISCPTAGTTFNLDGSVRPLEELASAPETKSSIIVEG